MDPDGRTDGRKDGRTHGRRQNYIPPTSSGDKNEGGIPTKCPIICLLFIRLDYKIWYQIKVETLPFNQNY